MTFSLWPKTLYRLCAAIAADCGGLVYANSLNGDFIYDDIHSIVQNPDIRSLWPPYWVLPTDAVNSRPVASFTLAVNYAFGGLALPGYRPFNIAVHLLCGLALYGVVRRTAASAALAFTCALVPNMAKGHNNLGTALKVVGRLQEALAHYRRALEIDYSYVLAHKNLALLLVDLGDLVAAVDHLVAIARLRPGDQQAQYAAGNALRAIEAWEAAAASYRRALAIDPDFAAARQGLAGVLQQKDAQF